MNSNGRKTPTSMSISPEVMERVRASRGLNASAICEEALIAAVEAMETGKPVTLTYSVALVKSITTHKDA